jgi:acyl-homoserine-lactone acylase
VAIAPGRSSDGYTRLLVNSHQPLTGPVAWYEARLHSEEGWDIAGATFPGGPLIIHGHNRYLGWSNTVNKPDLVDVYQLTLNPDNPNQYLLDGEWRDLEVRSAEILVKLIGPLRWTVSEPLYFSEHGPVVKRDHGSYALRWAGRGEIRILEQMLAFNKARNRDEFEAALAMAAQPSINYVYADRDGNIGHYYNATLPKRQEGWDWSKDLPGDRSELIWRDYLPFQAIPMTRNPPSGFVFNANNTPFVSTVGEGQPSPEKFSATLGIETHMNNRAYRLRRLLDADNSISREEFRQIKYDLHYDEDLPGMQKYRRFLASGLNSAGLDSAGLNSADTDLKQAFALLESWDGSTRRDSRAAALALLTLEPLLDFRHKDDEADLTVSLRKASDHLLTHFGRIDPEFGEVNRLQRGDLEWPLDGGPDILRAVYGAPDPEHGTLINQAGDSYIMFVEWDPQGRVHSSSVHSFGSATLDASSKHYADQSPLFAAMREKPMYLELEELLQHSSRDYTPLEP